MKKITALLLVCVLLAASVLPAEAQAKRCDCGVAPVVQIYGFGSLLAVEKENGKKEDLISVGSVARLLQPALQMLTEYAVCRDEIGVEKKAAEIIEILFGALRLNDAMQHENPIVNKTETDTSVDKHKLTKYSLKCEGTQDGCGDYAFRYDWSLDPLLIADSLHSFIEEVKQTTGHDRVVLSAHSMGNAVLIAYLYKYGTDSVEKIVDLCGAFQGLSLVGQLFTGDLDLHDRGAALYDFLLTLLGTDGIFGFLNGYIEHLTELGLLDVVTEAIADIMDEAKDELYDDSIRGLFAGMPAIWCFVPDEYYEDAKQYIFGDSTEGHENLIRIIDDYHYHVQVNAVSILRQANNRGIPVCVVSGYGCAPIPVSSDLTSQGDMLIDTKYTSLGATAAPYGGVLDTEGGAYVSPDKQIDASTCAFPDSTWFIKYQDHNDFCEPFNRFVTWLILFDGQPTVTTEPLYPQFMICRDNHDRLEPVSEEDDIHSENLCVFALLKKLFVRLLRQLVNGFTKLSGCC